MLRRCDRCFRECHTVMCTFQKTSLLKHRTISMKPDLLQFKFDLVCVKEIDAFIRVLLMTLYCKYAFWMSLDSCKVRLLHNLLWCVRIMWMWTFEIYMFHLLTSVIKYKAIVSVSGDSKVPKFYYCYLGWARDSASLAYLPLNLLCWNI